MQIELEKCFYLPLRMSYQHLIVRIVRYNVLEDEG